MKKGLIQVWLLGFILTGCLYGAINTGPYLTPGDNPKTSVWVNWNTTNAAQSRVAYGTSSSALNDTASSSGTTEFHHVLLDNLNPGTVYYYKVLPSGDVKHFRTFPNSADSFNFIAFGDTRDGDNPHQQIMNRMWDYDFVLVTHSGDLVGRGNRWSDWTTFFDIEDTVISYKQFLPAVGNHEYPYTQFDSLFKLPEGNNNNYYSLDYGNAHFVVLNTQSDISAESTWLVNDLQAANNNPNIVWKFANFHRPPYSSGPHGSASDIRAKWCPVLEEYGVDIVFNGHDHDYERSIDINGTVYIVTGGGGAPLYNPDSNWWTAHVEGTYHFCLIEIRDDDLLLKAIKRDGTVFDTLRLHKAAHEPWITITNTDINDPSPGGNGNNQLEPGETANLLITLKNQGGVQATNTNGLLRTSDPYITINDSTTTFGNIAPDSQKTNNADPFNITASDSTPTGHTVQFELIVTANDYNDTLNFDIMVGTKDYYVWNPDPTPSPGQQIDSILTALGYSGDYGTSLASDLTKYKSVFVCVGVYSNSYMIRENSPEASALADYLQNQHGRMYLEGADVWYWDPNHGGYNFNPLFAINPTDEGTNDMGPVVGQSGRFTAGMNFNYNGENNYMDHISPTGNGFLIFVDGDNNYDCGVAHDAGDYRTVGTSFELGGLVDGSPPSTRAALLDSIMHFFGISINPGVKEQKDLSMKPAKTQLTQLYPNPTNSKTTIKFQINHNTPLSLKIYDAMGRLVRTIIDSPDCKPGYYTVKWEGNDNRGRKVSNGIYFLSFQTDTHKTLRKVIVIKR